MSIYAIGDIQGCHQTLRRLLDRIEHDPTGDVLWLTGDLVNRGPASLEVLRWAVRLGDRVVSVLGNHDLHLLAVAAGVRKSKGKDTFGEVLTATDRDELLEWLRLRPLLHREGATVLVHAGLLPRWSVEEAERLARAGEEALRSSDPEFLKALYDHGNTDYGRDKVAAAVDALTRLRAVTLDGNPDWAFKGHPDDLPSDLVPWFRAEGRASDGATVVFGHWAALGLCQEPGVVGLDTGCVWGQTLTAYRLEDGALFQEPRAD